MAQIFPDDRKTRVVFTSRSEQSFYEQCKHQLGSQWHVFYSCTLSQIEDRSGVKDNEIDFVLYHPRYGVLVIEVKGGRIKYDVESNNFFSVDRHGQRFAIKNPFNQALNAKSRVIKLLKSNGIQVPVTQFVCFPNVYLDSLPEHAVFDTHLIIDRERLNNNLETFFKKAVYKAQPEQYLRFNDCREALKKTLIGTSFTTRFYLRDYIDYNASKVKNLETIYENFIKPVSSIPRAGIEGDAGTGKTFMAMQLAQYFRNQGFGTLFLSSNLALNEKIAPELGENITIKTYEQLSQELGASFFSKPDDYPGSKDDWMQVEAPSRLMQAIESKQIQYDVIICDEAQDVQPFWWDVICKLINESTGKLYIFFDRSQGIFGSGSHQTSFTPEDVLPVKTPYFPLVHNYRTTKEIAQFSRTFRRNPSPFEGQSSRLGYLPQLLTYKNIEDAHVQLEKLILNLTQEEKILPEEITILSARKINADASILASLSKIGPFTLEKFNAHNARQDRDHSKIYVSTIPQFKGLESPITILVNFSEYNMPASNPIMSSLIYVAATRAQHMMYILVKENSARHQEFKAALRELSYESGSIVIDPLTDEEFLGTITYYDPQRFGKIQVDHPSLKGSDILFFPIDLIQAKQIGIKVGQQIRFIPRIVGSYVMATHMRIVSSTDDTQQQNALDF